jgi:hypothetical protein
VLEKKRLPATVLAVLVAAAVAACTSEPTTEPDPQTDADAQTGLVIESAHWWQFQAIEHFDSEPGEATAPAQLERLAEIIEAHDLLGDVTLGEICEGGRSTTVDYVTDDGDDFTIRLEGCGGGAAADAIDDLVSEWREAR